MAMEEPKQIELSQFYASVWMGSMFSVSWVRSWPLRGLVKFIVICFDYTMWKKVGNVRAGDTSSIRSNLSKEEQFQYYYKHHSSVDEKRTPFCQDFFSTRRSPDSIRDRRNDSRSPSQLSNPHLVPPNAPHPSSNAPNSNDLFSHIRTVFSSALPKSNDAQPSLIDFKTSRMASTIRPPHKQPAKLREKLKETSKKLASLRSEQQKLKQIIQREVGNFGVLMRKTTGEVGLRAKADKQSLQACLREARRYESELSQSDLERERILSKYGLKLHQLQ